MTAATRSHAARRGFTLVELITAASLMTVMMMGVVQVFAIVSETASEAEGIHFAQQQMRAFFDRLHTDFRGMTREGYLQVIHKAKRDTISTPDGRTSSGPYSQDTLAFVAVGPCQTQMTRPEQTTPGACAEVVYTNYVRTDSAVLTIAAQAGAKHLSARRGILGRGTWLLDGGTGGAALDTDSQSKFLYLSDMYKAENEAAGGSIPDRIGTSPDGHLTIWPWLEGESTPPSHAESLNRVMACCVSEFYVEVFDPSDYGGTANASGDLFENVPEGMPHKYTWTDVPASASGASVDGWPKAIRVTVAVHDPDETSLLPLDQKRFRGFAMQEVFWFGDP